MMTSFIRRFALVGILAMAAGVPVVAQEGNGGDYGPPVVINLDRYTGCWHNRQGDFNFVVNVGNSGFLMIELRDPNDASWMGGREPYLSWLNPSGYVLGTVPLQPHGDNTVVGRVVKGLYSIGWAPRASWGGKVLMTVCFSRNPNGF